MLNVWMISEVEIPIMLKKEIQYVVFSVPKYSEKEF
jgi:hypothetical protein